MSNYIPEVKDTLDGLLLGLPGVVGGKSFGYPAYKVNGRIFGFVCAEGAAFKLAKGRAPEVISAGRAFPFEVEEGMVWKDWIYFRHDDLAAYEDDLPLLEESFQFVAQG